MASIPFENLTVSAYDDKNEVKDDQYDYYYYDYHDEHEEGVDWPYLLFDVLLGVAVLVDLLLVVVVLSGRKLRRGPSAIFIISLAVFDVLHLVSIRLSLYVLQQYEMHPAGHLICKFGVFVDSMFGNTAVFLLVTLAAERYVAVVHPLSLQKRRVSPFTWSVFCVLLTWTLATLLAVPDIFAHSMEDLVFTEDDAGKLDGEFSYTTATTTNDDNVSAAASDAVNASIIADDVQQVVYGRHCALVGTGWLFWYPSARPVCGFVAYYVVPMLLIGVLYGRVVCTLLTTASQRLRSADRDQLRRKQAARSNSHSITSDV